MIKIKTSNIFKKSCLKKYGISALDFLSIIKKWDKNDTEEERDERWDKICKEYNVTNFTQFIIDIFGELK